MENGGADLYDWVFGDSSKAFEIGSMFFPEDPGVFIPRVDLYESNDEVKVVVELPGMDEKEVIVELDENSLILQGEKTSGEEKKSNRSYCVENSYGSFRRIIQMPPEVDSEKITACFKKGVLRIILPKRKKAQPNKKTIKIKTG